MTIPIQNIFLTFFLNAIFLFKCRRLQTDFVLDDESQENSYVTELLDVIRELNIQGRIYYILIFSVKSKIFFYLYLVM